MKNNGIKTSSLSSEGNFYAIGLNYKKADAEIRGHFSISEEAQVNMLTQAKEEGIVSLSVISTCNRTELYGIAQHPFQLIKLLCQHTNGTVEEFEKVAYIHKNKDAVSHLFKVGTGLDSQILGDFEIISQLRNGFRRSKSMGVMDPFLERLANAVIQASKRIKNETEISTGATSVSFAAVQYIMARVPYVSEKNILLFGTGKIGRNTCENLIKHTKNEHITLINRTKNKAEKIAGKFNLVVKDYANIQSEIAQSDILIVATGAQHPTISKELLFLKKPLLVLDLSIPKNVSEDVTKNPLVTLVHLDNLASVTDKTLERRAQQIPMAEAIIEEIMTDFNNWAENRKFAPTIKALKSKLAEIKAGEIDFQRKKIDNFNEEQAEIISNRIIQKITTHFANHLKNDSISTPESVELIKQVFQLSTAEA
ncbi:MULTISPECIES: glutamyl-tRNA reductase [Altibacter]|uniref:glutamyl-tRNA reductase n=1 Tax=Altibacter TaxID=1535231 RepID=UPI0005522299|nr:MULTISPECIES: glutamyl-tRNA reductase [Altibacter]MCW8981016.1 glutamyl-tRNA reductase [Altibacter sp.]MCW9038114.1 glutamyl-tRNA reductase [Altibacter sp.]